MKDPPKVVVGLGARRSELRESVFVVVGDFASA